MPWHRSPAGWASQSAQAASAYAYTPITPTLTGATITLTGHDLTIEQIVQVARYGAKVELSPAARQREADKGTRMVQAQTLIKVQHARQAVDTTMDMLGQDLLEASLWMDVRKAQTPGRNFGPASTAAWTAFRKEIPLRPGFDSSSTESETMAAAAFVHKTDPGKFYSTALPTAAGEKAWAASCVGGRQ